MRCSLFAYHMALEIFFLDLWHLRGGVGQAYHFGKNDFKLGVGGEGQDTSRHFEGGIGSMRTILTM